ncbi:MAG: metallophosphoesterase family protein [Novosphingobium sp.]
MIKSLSKLFRPQPATPPASVPPGQRVYAVGDIHGCRDLFDALIAAIETDDAARAPAETTIVLLGDLIDRGPDSAGVIASARALQARRDVRILCGNHEEMFLRCFADLELFRHFLRYGGRETILSYPLDQTRWNAADLDEAHAMMRAAVPAADLEFIRSFEDSIVIGDYAFVHAGILPGQPIEDQDPGDTRWIREPFLSDSRDHGFVIVHGHTITETPVFRRNRIGIDTGAYSSNRLTALALEGESRWIISTNLSQDVVTCETAAA